MATLSTFIREKSLRSDNEPERIKMIQDSIKCCPRTWHANEPRRHWEMSLHCEKVMFPRPFPNLPLPTSEGRFYWHLYSTTTKHQHFYQKDLNSAFLTTLYKILRKKTLMTNITLPEQLIRLESLDDLNRRIMIGRLEKYLRRQTVLESLCLEGLQLKRVEGLRLVLALFKSRTTLKYLYCWRAFKRKEGPLLVDTGHFSGSGLYADRVARKCDWFKAICCLDALTTLSVNYAYIATPNGDLLVALAKQIGSHWYWLQLLCLEEELPILANPDDGVGGYVIPDIAWRETKFWAPSLKVQYVFVGIPEYDKHKRFFTKNCPVHTFMLSTGADLRFQQPWFIDCTIKTVLAWYSETLVHLYLQLWHHREILDTQLKELFPNLPKLKVFEFIGEIRSMNTLCAMCCQIRDRRCEVNCANVQLQDTTDIKKDRKKWTRSIECLLTCFRQDFVEMGVKFEISYYPC